MNMRGELLGSPIDGEAFACIRRRLSALATLLDAPFGGRRMQSLIRGAPVTFRVLGEEGQWMNTPCLGWSISELTQAEEALALLAAIVASSDDAIVSKSLEGVILSWNAGAERLFGYSSAEAIGQRINLIIPSELQEQEVMILDRLRRGERIEHLETVRLTKDGRRIDISLTVSPVRDSAGHIVAASKIARDITERKRAREALEASEERLRLALEAGRLGIWEWHFPTNTVSWSPGLEAIHGLAPGSFPGTWEAYQQGIHPEDRADVLRSIAKTVEHGEEHHLEYRILGSHGRPRWVEERGRLFLNRHGEPERMTGLCADITERKWYERELREAGHRKDEFLATLAHELRNPLAPIRNAVQVLHVKDLPGARVSWARDVIERQVRHMARLLDDLLDVSRVTQNRLQLQTSIVPLASIIDSAAETSRPLIHAAGHRLTLLLPGEPIHLHADPVRLAQVFSNLLNNAARYTPDGGRIDVIAERHGHEVVVSVHDNGIGIAPHMLDRVFDLFSQAEPAAKRSQGGLGIGLSLAKALVEMHGGSIEACSDGPGTGSRFIVRLPVLAEQVVPQDGRADADEHCGQRLRILIADDLEDSADTLATVLAFAGHEVRTAYDGEGALVAAEAFRPHVVFLDLGMPKLNGYEVCRRIREQPWGKEMAVIAVSGWGMQEDRKRAQAFGFDRHFVKPVDPDALVQALGSMSWRADGRRR